METPTTFPLARFRLLFRVTTPLRLPAYAGSTLRGPFGAALRHIVCLTRARSCTGCSLLRSCPYPLLFEPPPPLEEKTLQTFSQTPCPYIIEPPPWGERLYPTGSELSFHLVLVGRAIQPLPFIVLAWQRAFAGGIGRGKGSAHLEKIFHDGDEEETEIFQAEEARLHPHPEVRKLPWHGPPDHRSTTATDTQRIDRVTLRFHTPMRLQQNGSPLGPERIQPRALLMAAVRRVCLLATFHTQQVWEPDFQMLSQLASQITSGVKRLRWRDWSRYSHRQQQAMTLGGVVGEWTLKGELTPFLPFLQVGQWVHLGKNSTFGLGHYQMITEEVDT